MGTAVFPEVLNSQPPQVAVLETWQNLDHSLANLLHNQGDRANVIADLDAHLNTLPVFIESFLGEEADYGDIMDVHGLLIGLHEASLIKSVATRGLDARKLQLTSVADREATAVAIMYALYDEPYDSEVTLSQLAATNLSRSLRVLLTANINVLYDSYQEIRNAEHAEKVAKFKARAKSIGNMTLRAGATGLAAFYITRRLQYR